MEHLEPIAYTWKMTYDMGVQDVRISSMPPADNLFSPAVDQ